MKQLWLALPLILGLAACSKDEERAVGASAVADNATEAKENIRPGIDASVAPGVAFDFSYGFSLPENQIAPVQEAHAALCRRLGITHCRVTGVRFIKERGGSIDAGMTFLLDPAMALGFGKDASVLVENADGSLATSSVKGEDVGKSIIANDKSADGIRAELAKIDAQLRIPGLLKGARGKLVAESGELRERLRALEGERAAAVESLASTPVSFSYEVQTGGISDSLRQGLNAGGFSATVLMHLLAITIGALGPWALLLGAGWALLRRFRRKPQAVSTP